MCVCVCEQETVRKEKEGLKSTKEVETRRVREKTKR